VLCQLRRRKKKANFIIPPTYYRNSDYSIVESQKSKVKSVDVEVTKTEEIVPKVENVVVKTEELQTPNSQQPNSVTPSAVEVPINQTKVSALSLASIKAKREMAEAQKSVVKETVHLPSEPFTETQMLEQWMKYAQRMEDKGYRIIASLLTLNDPILEGTTIIHELPNESSKIDFEKERPDLLGYLRGKLHNHDITIEARVNESIEVKKAFTPQDKYNRLREINPNLDLLRKMFDLDV
jgi:DNA polymerase-3 subunit gamma/tau